MSHSTVIPVPNAVVGHGFRWPSILLAASMFFTGAAGLVAEYILGTVATYVLGNSIEQMSITIAGAMLFMGIGGWAQQHISNQRLIEKFVALEMLLALLIGFAPIAIYAAFGFMEDHFNLVLYSFIAAIGFLIGLEIPLATRINEQYDAQLKKNLGNMLSMDYVGSFVGALVWVYVLLQRFPLTEISFLVASSNFTIAVITFLYFWRQGKVASPRLLVLMIAATLATLTYGYTANRDWSTRLEQRMYEDPIVFAETTKYQHLVMTHTRSLDEHRLYINGNLQFSSVDEAIYHEQLVHPAMTLVPNHARVLILGGGDGLALREVLKYPDVQEVTLVDLDPDMVRLAAEHPVMQKLNANAFNDARVARDMPDWVSSHGLRTLRAEAEHDPHHARQTKAGQRVTHVGVINIDADRFLEGVGQHWNVVIVDFPDPSSIELVKLYSVEFFQKLRRVVGEDGMIVIQSTSPYHAKESYLCIRRTMEAAGLTTLPYHDNVPSFGDWGWILAWQSCQTIDDMREQIADIQAFDVPTVYLTPDVLQKSSVFGKGWLTSKYTDINTLMQPVLLQRYTKEAWLVE